MCLRAPLNRRDSYGPPPDVLGEYWRGIQEVGGGQEEAFVESLYAAAVQQNVTFFFRLLIFIHHHCAHTEHVFAALCVNIPGISDFLSFILATSDPSEPII